VFFLVSSFGVQDSAAATVSQSIDMELSLRSDDVSADRPQLSNIQLNYDDHDELNTATAASESHEYQYEDGSMYGSMYRRSQSVGDSEVEVADDGDITTHNERCLTSNSERWTENNDNCHEGQRQLSVSDDNDLEAFYDALDIDTDRLPLSARDTDRLPLSARDTDRLPLSARDTDRLTLSARDTDRPPLSASNTDRPTVTSHMSQCADDVHMLSERSHNTDRLFECSDSSLPNGGVVRMTSEDSHQPPPTTKPSSPSSSSSSSSPSPSSSLCPWSVLVVLVSAVLLAVLFMACSLLVMAYVVLESDVDVPVVQSIRRLPEVCAFYHDVYLPWRRSVISSDLLTSWHTCNRQQRPISDHIKQPRV